MVEKKHNEQMDAYRNLEWSVVANSVLRRNFVMSWRMVTPCVTPCSIIRFF